MSPMKPCKNPTSELPSSHIWVGLCLQLTSSQRIMNLSRDKHSANDVVLMVCNSPPSCQHVYFSLSTLWMSHLSSFHNPNTLQNIATTCPPVHVFTTFSFWLLLLKILFLLHFVFIHNPQRPLSKTMASEQERRDNTTKERETHLEAERVPKMTSHFESLSERVKGGDMARSESTVPPSEEGSGKGGEARGGESRGPRAIGKFEMNVGEEKGSSRGGSEEREVDTERSSKEGGRDEEKETTPSLEEISKFREKAQQNSMEAIRAAEERYQKAKELGASKLQDVKESVAPRVESATTYATEKGAQVKDTALEKSQQGYTTAKDTLVTAGKTAADYTKQTAEQGKDYTLQKATQAKDVSLETSKGAAGYAGKKAAELKDKALATGWGAAHYTTEKAVEATKAAAGAIQSTAEYTGEKVVDYTGRKREEAQQELAAKQSPETKVFFTNYPSKVCVLFCSSPKAVDIIFGLIFLPLDS